jgi:hypothetical protein
MMATNVRCAGGGRLVPWAQGVGGTEMRYVAGHGLVIRRHGDPCGWRGERRPKGHAEMMFDPRTVRPCPRCGGRVELIPEEA